MRVLECSVLLFHVLCWGAGATLHIDENATDQGMAAFKITTDNAVYYLQKRAGGISSMLDRDSADWIGANSEDGASGMYRGIPNMVHPGDIFHPMHTHCDCSVNEQFSSDDSIRIDCASNDGTWHAYYVFYHDHCAIVMSKMDRDYWFLYEGTPNGEFNEQSNYWLVSDGTTADCGTTKNGDIPAPEWICFGDDNTDRVLFLHHCEDDDAPDKYYAMSPMTVFGFGRSGLTKYLSSVPQRFHIGFIEHTAYAAITDSIAAIAQGRTEVILGADRFGTHDGTPHNERMAGAALDGYPAIAVTRAAHQLYVSFTPAQQVNTTGPLHIDMYDMQGVQVRSYRPGQADVQNRRISIDTRSLAGGQYILTLTQGGTVHAACRVVMLRR